VPYRFFLAAPWFGVMAGILLVWSGGDALSSRWTPEALALTHLIAPGFMLQAMCGALLQFIPVAVGGNVWRPRLVANTVQPLLILATLLLIAGLLFSRPGLLSVAAPLFLPAVGGFVTVVALALWQTPATGMTLWAMRMAIGGLAVTVLFGALLAEALALGFSVPIVELADIHLAWGLAGWALMLLAGVSYYVVPMFQLTRPYPLWFTRWFGPLLLLVLLAWSSRLFFENAMWSLATALSLLSLVSVYAGMTLWLQYTRRRKIDDATSMCFRVANLSMLAFSVSGAGVLLYPELGTDPRSAIWLGVLAFAGVFVSAITGMMYKIVPFLNWLHLQRLGARGALAAPGRARVGGAHHEKDAPGRSHDRSLAPACAGCRAAAGRCLAARVDPVGRCGLCFLICLDGLESDRCSQALPVLQISNSRNRFTSLMVICLPLTPISPLVERS
ncbi:MAG: hypothetical protein NTX56_19420, partial [Proteobacteria bacterium]|nr:hypothetical protein [Pseudomonadota bacterium]